MMRATQPFQQEHDVFGTPEAFTILPSQRTTEDDTSRKGEAVRGDPHEIHEIHEEWPRVPTPQGFEAIPHEALFFFQAVLARRASLARNWLRCSRAEVSGQCSRAAFFIGR